MRTILDLILTICKVKLIEVESFYWKANRIIRSGTVKTHTI